MARYDLCVLLSHHCFVTEYCKMLCCNKYHAHAHIQMSKKALMERAKEDKKKSDTGEKAKGKPKVLSPVLSHSNE